MMRTWTKRAVALLLIAAFAGCTSVYAADGTQAVYTLTQDGNTLSMKQLDEELTFWEAPDVVTGQNRLDGTIILKNESDRTVDFVLSSVSLPYDNTAALTYLDAVSVDLSADGETMYHGSLTRIMDRERAEVRVADVLPGEERTLAVSVSCAYTYTGQVPSYSSLVWTFTPQVKSSGGSSDADAAPTPESSGIDWVPIARVVGAVALVIVLARIVGALIRRRKCKH